MAGARANRGSSGPEPTAGGSPYAAIEAAYDRAAGQFGTTFGTGPAGARAKAVAMQRIRAVVPRGSRLLDIGCDIGYEAVHFGKLGYSVVGLDLSTRMLAIAEQRRAEAGLSPAVVRFRQLAAARVGELAQAGVRFDAAYSIYGALNLEPDAKAFGKGLARLLPAEAPVFVGLLNPAPLFEIAAYPFALRFKGWRKLLRRDVQLKIVRGGEDALPCRMPFPRTFARDLHPWFRLASVEAVHIFLPPPTPFLLAKPALLRRITALENRLARRAPWNRLGYFALLEFRRTGARP
jgi:SAM-dependent methyltransferase